MDIVKIKAYYLVISYALTMIENKSKEMKYIDKKQVKFSFNGMIEKQKMIARLRNIKEASDSLNKTSHEMLVYIALDFLINVERDTATRGKFLHINTAKKLMELEKEYPKELKEHYVFFSKLVDNL